MNSPSTAVAMSSTAPDMATIDASRPTDIPAERMTMISLLPASAPKPSREPIRVATGIRLFRRTCTRMTTRSCNPFDRAVRT